MERYSDPPTLLQVLQVVVVLLVLPLTLFRGSCVSEDVAIKAATTSGYTNPKVLDRHYFFVGWQGCSGSDAAGFDVEAINPQGQKVQLLVCSGFFVKAATVRIP